MPFFLAQLWVIIKDKVGVAMSIAILAVLSLSYYAYSTHKAELRYHAWAGSYSVHKFDEDKVEVKTDDHSTQVRVFWLSFPRTAPWSFEEQYILYRPIGEPVGILEKEHPYPIAEPYRSGYAEDEVNTKRCNCWGRWLDVGKLEPGLYQLKVRYDYDPWWLPDWSAQQRIVFTVE